MGIGGNKHEILKNKGGIFDIFIQVYDWTYSGTECVSKGKTLN